ncbi:aldo/keto reductase [Micromonospora sp. NPDC005979]|uniref:aldo/keto reductase n=1 Tax=Micromonospora sp. NPDC005979 TaxID=3156726 RepID=UPI0033B9B5F4
MPYSLVNRDAERELLPMAEAYGMTVTAWSPLGGGVLSGKYNAGPPQERTRLSRDTIGDRDLSVARVVQEVAGELGVTPAQVALAWTRHRSGVLPIIGARTVEQLRDNLGCTAVTLPPELALRLETATGFSLGFPADFIAETRQWVLGAAA